MDKKDRVLATNSGKTGQFTSKAISYGFPSDIAGANTEAEIQDTYWLTSNNIYISPDTEDNTIQYDTSKRNIDSNELIRDVRMLEIIATLEEMKTKQDTHAQDTTAEHQELLGVVKLLNSENEYFRRQVSQINTPQKLRKYSIIVCLLCLVFYFLNKATSVILFHPIVIYLALSVSIGTCQ